jgi:hypothetical protein
VSPLVPFKVALLEVTEVAASVVGAVAAYAEGVGPNSAKPNALTTSAKAASTESDFLVMLCKILFFIFSDDNFDNKAILLPTLLMIRMGREEDVNGSCSLAHALFIYRLVRSTLITS